MAISFGFSEVVKPAVEARLGLRVVVTLPLPEERLDLGDVRAARDVLDGLVVDGQRPSSRRNGLPSGPVSLSLTVAFWPGL